MNPEYTDEQLRDIESAAEADVYCRFRDQLSNDWHVYHSVTWIQRREEDEARDGEIDFVVCHPDYGLITIEVKGGGVGYDAHADEWYSINRHNQKNTISDPVGQARRAKYSILKKLQDHPKWRSLRLGRITLAHAVMFPDLTESQRPSRSDLPKQIVGIETDLAGSEAWLTSVFDYWRGESDQKDPLTKAGISLFDSVFARSFEARPLLSRSLESEEEERLALTNEQARILDILRARRRVAISGGAGTGKTVLAVEKARRLADEGFRTLLTCYNRPLADHLVRVCEDIDNLEVMNFHQLCQRRVRQADQLTGRNLLEEAKSSYPRENLWNVHWPNALSYSTDILEDRYDAIVCDEGQDFGEDYWIPIELLLADEKNSPLYIFYDENQDLYARASSFPITDEPFPLTINCRNTCNIHNASYHYYHGEAIAPPAIEGRDVEVLAAASVEPQVKKLHRRIVELIDREGVQPEDIVVLVANAYHKSTFYEALRHRPLPGGAQWLEEGEIEPGKVLMETVKRFKGLEAPIVFLWGIDGLNPEKDAETLYVGLSRPKSILGLVGQPDQCETLLQLNTEEDGD